MQQMSDYVVVGYNDAAVIPGQARPHSVQSG